MIIVVNGDELDVDGPLTVRGLIERLDLAGGPVAVERNGEVVPRAEHATTSVIPGDRIEIVHFVGGG